MPRAPRYLFAYGTLMVPEVVWRLLGHPLDSERAEVRGFKRFRVKDAVYPGVVASEPSDSVSGMLLSGLSESDWETLDRYEGSEYDRVSTRAILKGHQIDTEIYLFNQSDRITDEPWDDSKVLEQLKDLGLED